MTFLAACEPSTFSVSIRGSSILRREATHSSGGVGLLVNIRSELLLRIEGAVWVELQVEEGNNMIVGMVYVNPEGVRVQESEMLFEMMKAKVTDYQEAGFEVLVVSDFNTHVGLGVEQSPNRNGRKLLDLVECEIYM